MASTVVSGNSYKELSQEEGRRLFDRLARRYLRMSGEEFLRAWETGKFKSEDESPEVAQLVMLIPLAT